MPHLPLLEQQLDQGGLWPSEKAALDNLLQVLRQPRFFIAPLRLDASTQGHLRQVRGEFIASLITHLTPFFIEHEPDSARYTELHLIALEIQDNLNLSELTLPFPLRLIRCTVKGEINCSKSYLAEFSLQECEIGALTLNLSQVSKGVHIKDSLIKERLCLAETIIGGSLLIEGSPGHNSFSLAQIGRIDAEEIHVRHSLKLTGLHVNGHLNFRFCWIGSDFVVSECVITNSTSCLPPLSLDNGVIRGDMHLHRITLLHQRAEGENPGGKLALSAMHSRIRGNFTVEELSWNNPIELSSMQVGGHMSLRGLSMITGGQTGCDCALAAKGLRVRGQLYIEGQWGKASGQLYGGLHLPSALIGMDAHLRRLTIHAPGYKALSLSGALIQGKLQMGEGLKIIGLVRMIALKVQGKLALYQSHLRGTLTEKYKTSSVLPTALEARGITIYGDLELGEKCLIEGCVDLAGLKVNGSLRMKKCVILPPSMPSVSDQDLSSVITLNLEGGSIQRELDIANDPSPEPSPFTLPTEPADITHNLFAGTLNLRHLKAGTLRDGVETSDVLSIYPPPAHTLTSPLPFASHILLDGFVYRSIPIGSSRLSISLSVRRRLNWLSHHNHPFSPQPYEHYARHLTQLGLESSSINVHIRKWDDYLKSYARKGLSAWRLIQLYIMKYVLDYGYRPWKSVYFILGFIFLGTLVFRLGYQAGHITPSSADVLLSADYREKGILPADYPAFNAFFYALDTFIPLVSMHIEEYWAPSKDLTPPSLVIRTYFVIHVVAGWFLVTAAIGGFIGILKPPV